MGDLGERLKQTGKNVNLIWFIFSMLRRKEYCPTFAWDKSFWSTVIFVFGKKVSASFDSMHLTFLTAHHRDHRILDANRQGGPFGHGDKREGPVIEGVPLPCSKCPSMTNGSATIDKWRRHDWQMAPPRLTNGAATIDKWRRHD
jgi:hypothetical protein